MKEFSLFEDFSEDMDDKEDMENLSDDDTENFSLNDSENTEDFCLFEDFIEGKKGRGKGKARSLKSRRRSRRRKRKKRKTCLNDQVFPKIFLKNRKRKSKNKRMRPCNPNNKNQSGNCYRYIHDLSNNVWYLSNENKDYIKKNNDLTSNVKSLSALNAELLLEFERQRQLAQNGNVMSMNYLAGIQNQNQTLDKNIKYLKGAYSTDKQKFNYEKQHINYWLGYNFWLFYIYMFIAIIYGVIYFLFIKKDIYVKIFWYLHVFFYPYLIMYTEIALYLFFTYLYDWIAGKPFTMWHYFTSYPPIV